MLKPKQTHLIVSFVVSIATFLFLLLVIVLDVFADFIVASESLTSTLLTIDGILIGFIMSALGIFCSITLKPEIKVALVKQGYYKQIVENFISSMIEFSVSMIFSIIIMCFSSKDNPNLFVKVIASLEISTFIGSLILLIATSKNFFKIITKN